MMLQDHTYFGNQADIGLWFLLARIDFDKRILALGWHKVVSVFPVVSCLVLELLFERLDGVLDL